MWGDVSEGKTEVEAALALVTLWTLGAFLALIARSLATYYQRISSGATVATLAGVQRVVN